MDTPDLPWWLRYARRPAVCVALALLCALPTVGMGLFADDFMHIATLEGVTSSATPENLFTFATGDPERTRAQLAEGTLPWWSTPELRLNFWRPLTSALSRLDHAAFGHFAPGYHLHSVVWYLLVVGLAARVLSHIAPGPVGALAGLLFAIDEAHVTPVAWIANRNALVASALALAGTLAWLRAREGGARWTAVALLGWSLGLLAGETALGVLAITLWWQLSCGPGTLRARVRQGLPIVGLTAAFLVVYKARGSGAWGSGVYIDPLASPAAWMLEAPGRLAALLGALIAGTPVDLYLFAGAGSPVVGALVVAGLLAALWVAWLTGRLRRHGEVLSRPLMVFVVGAVGLSLLPVVSTFPASRLLTVATLPTCLGVAALLWRGWLSFKAGALSGVTRLSVVALAVIHLALPVPLWYGQVAALTPQWSHFTRQSLSLPEYGQGRSLWVGGHMMVGAYGWYIRRFSGVEEASWQQLSLSAEPHAITRRSDAVIEMTMTRRPLLIDVFERLFRDEAHPMAVGEEVLAPGMVARVVEVDGLGRPERVEFRLEPPPSQRPTRLVWAQGAEIHSAPVPEIGQTLAIPAFSLLELLDVP